MLQATIEKLDVAETLLDVQDVVRHGARELVRADGATFVLRDDDKCFYVEEDAMSPLWKGQRFPVHDCISGWAMLHHEQVVVPDISEDARIPMDAYRPTFVKSLAMTPIGAPEPVGAIGAYWARIHEATDTELAVLRELAAATARAIGRIGLADAPFTPPNVLNANR